ncbi:MAG: uracil-DNA glycosylase family protein [Polyangiaceae bacterium]
MSEPTEPELSPREELASLIASTRALLEQYEASGADLLPSSGGAALAHLPAGPEPAARPAPAPSRAERPAFHAPERAAPAQPERPAFTPPVQPERPAFTPPAHAGQAGPSMERPAFAAPGQAGPSMERAAFTAPGQAGPSMERAAVAAPERGAASERVGSGGSGRAGATGAEHAPLGNSSAFSAEAPPYSGKDGEGDDRKMRLALLAEEVRPCVKCGLCDARTQTVFSRGNPFAEVFFVGEGPGQDEDAQGFPFVGRAGQLLDRMIVAMGYARDEVYIANIVKCRPPNNRKPEPAEMEACMPYLRQQIALVKPKVLVALGATANSGLTGASEGIMRARGKWKLYKGTIPIMPTYHPAYLLRNPAAKREVWNDLQEVMKHLGRPVPRSGGRSDS